MAKLKASIHFFIYYLHETFPNSVRIRFKEKLSEKEAQEACQRFATLESVKKTGREGDYWIELAVEPSKGRQFKTDVINLAKRYYIITDVTSP